MSLSIGIVGLPNVGKSTLFNALTKKSVLVANYPFATIDPSVGVVAVPDERLWKLSEFSKSAKTVPAAVEFVDIAGLVKGASVGEGLGNKFLSNIRETDAIAEVVRIFEDDSIIHVDNRVNPLKDIDVINLELVLADLETVTKRAGNILKEVKGGKKEAIAESALLEKVKKTLEEGKLVSALSLHEEEKNILKSLHLITAKKILYVLNSSAATKNALEEVKGKVPGEFVVVDPIFGTGMDGLIAAAYKLLGLITFFTTGEDETRGWTIPSGWTAPMAGTAIHGDFKDKFVKAEVVEWDKLLKAGSYAAAREKGLVKTEGKEYVVKDGDVVEFKI